MAKAKKKGDDKSPKEDKEKKEDEGVNTKIYARVRSLMPWEPKKVSLSVESTTTIRNRVGKITNQYDFGCCSNQTPATKIVSK